uniref:Chitin-binding type-2 domain-containing protein n=1 Tax=Syphacia muris TaxID=451379 RepID=A0A0N5ACZ3_9BILA
MSSFKRSLVVILLLFLYHLIFAQAVQGAPRETDTFVIADKRKSEGLLCYSSKRSTYVKCNQNQYCGNITFLAKQDYLCFEKGLKFEIC